MESASLFFQTGTLKNKMPLSNTLTVIKKWFIITSYLTYGYYYVVLPVVVQVLHQLWHGSIACVIISEVQVFTHVVYVIPLSVLRYAILSHPLHHL